MAWTGPLVSVAVLLMAAGLIKLRRPGPTQRALVLAGLPTNTAVVRLLGSVELVVGGTAALAGGRGLRGAAAAAAALLFAGFAVFLVAARRRGGPLASCGCFGTPDTPVTATHLVLDGLASATAALGAVRGTPGLPAAVAAHPAYAPALIVAVAGLTGLGYVAFAVAPLTGVSR